MTVAILGSGPAAILCAYACATRGIPYNVISPEPPKITGFNAGVYYLHESPLPEIIDGASRRIYTWWIGSDDIRVARREYAQKLYGDPEVPVSLHSGWSDVWNPARILPFCVDASDMKARWTGGSVRSVEELAQLRRRHELVMCTVPATVWGEDVTGALQSSKAYVKTGRAPEDEGYVLYNAASHVYWYRASAMFGEFTLESTHKPDASGADQRIQTVNKVFGEPPSLPFEGEGVAYMGRYAQWNKAYLSHQAFQDALDIIDGNG